MSLIRKLFERPPNLPSSSKFTIANGLFYLVAGGVLLAWPGAVQTLFRDAAFVGHEAGLVRALGMALMVIGWLYVFGGRTGARSVVASTVLDRVTLVPVVLLPLAFAGVFPHLFTIFSAIDVSLALGAWWLLNQPTELA